MNILQLTINKVNFLILGVTKKTLTSNELPISEFFNTLDNLTIVAFIMKIIFLIYPIQFSCPYYESIIKLQQNIFTSSLL